jgi:hypothetical protein
LNISRGSREKGKLGFGEGSIVEEPELFAIFTEASKYGWRVKTLACGASCSMGIISIARAQRTDGEE